MAWIVPTEAHIVTAQSGPELEAFRAAALADGQPDPLNVQIKLVVDFMRGYIFQCPNVDRTTKEEGTIPESGMLAFLEIITPLIQGRPAGAVIDGTSGIRLDARSDALKWLQAAAACKVAVDEVPPSTAEGAPMPTPRMKKRTRPNCHGI